VALSHRTEVDIKAVADFVVASYPDMPKPEPLRHREILEAAQRLRAWLRGDPVPNA
jgi:hypothetical protein